MSAGFANPPAERLRELLRRARVIAIVGLSPRPERPSHRVGSALKSFGYRIVPVRPDVDAVLGERAYADLSDVPLAIDIVDVFRAPEHVDAIVDRCLALGLKVLWLQEGVVNRAAAERARAAGMEVIMDRCLYREYVRHFGHAPHSSPAAPPKGPARPGA